MQDQIQPQADQTADISSRDESSEAQPIGSEQDKKSKRPFIILLVIVLLLFGILITIFYIMNKNSETDEKPLDLSATTTTLADIEETTTTTTTITDDAPTENPYEGWKTYTNPTYGYSFRYPEDVEVEEMPVHDCEGADGCLQIDNPGDVVIIQAGQSKLYISIIQIEGDEFDLGFAKADNKDPLEFMIGNTKAYAIFSKAESLRAIAREYKYEDTAINLKTIFKFGENRITFGTGIFPMNEISEKDFVDKFVPVLETFEG